MSAGSQIRTIAILSSEGKLMKLGEGCFCSFDFLEHILLAMANAPLTIVTTEAAGHGSRPLLALLRSWSQCWPFGQPHILKLISLRQAQSAHCKIVMLPSRKFHLRAANCNILHAVNVYISWHGWVVKVKYVAQPPTTPLRRLSKLALIRFFADFTPRDTSPCFFCSR